MRRKEVRTWLTIWWAAILTVVAGLTTAAVPSPVGAQQLGTATADTTAPVTVSVTFSVSGSEASGTPSGARPASSGGTNFACEESMSFKVRTPEADMVEEGACFNNSGAGFPMVYWGMEQTTKNLTYGTEHLNDETCNNVDTCSKVNSWDCGTCHGTWNTTFELTLDAPLADPFTKVGAGCSLVTSVEVHCAETNSVTT